MKDNMKDFYGNYASEGETAQTIKDLYEKTGYVIDTHTAVAATVLLNTARQQEMRRRQ